MKCQLYHGTSIENADRIMKEGFRDRLALKKGNWAKKVESVGGHVYLTSAYPFFFARQAAKKGDKTAAVIKVEVDLEDLYPDEDFLHFAGIPREKYINDLLPYKHVAHMSLRKLGNASIRPEDAEIKILGRKDFDLKQMFWHSDPTITMQNFAVLGDYYQRLTSAWWKDDPDWEKTERFPGEGELLATAKGKVHPLVRTRIAEIKKEKE